MYSSVSTKDFFRQMFSRPSSFRVRPTFLRTVCRFAGYQPRPILKNFNAPLIKGSQGDISNISLENGVYDDSSSTMNSSPKGSPSGEAYDQGKKAYF